MSNTSADAHVRIYNYDDGAAAGVQSANYAGHAAPAASLAGTEETRLTPRVRLRKALRLTAVGETS